MRWCHYYPHFTDREPEQKEAKEFAQGTVSRDLHHSHLEFKLVGSCLEAALGKGRRAVVWRLLSFYSKELLQRRNHIYFSTWVFRVLLRQGGGRNIL